MALTTTARPAARSAAAWITTPFPPTTQPLLGQRPAVGNETLEDYSLRFTAKSARRWSSFRVANTALGAISFLALEAIGGADGPRR